MPDLFWYTYQERRNHCDAKKPSEQMGTELDNLEDIGPVQVLNDCISSRSAQAVEGGEPWQGGHNTAEVKEYTQ